MDNPIVHLVSRVFLRHTLIGKLNEHPGTLRSNLPRKWADLQPLWISQFAREDKLTENGPGQKLGRLRQLR